MEFVIALTVVVFGFILVINWIQAMSKHKQEQLRVMENALRDASLDGETKREVIRAMERRETTGLFRFLFMLGWIGMFVGIAHLSFGNRHDMFAGGILLGVGIAMVSMPVALREMTERHGA